MGKASRISTKVDRLRRNQASIKNLEALGRSRNTPKPVATTAFSGSSGAGDAGGTGNYLLNTGGAMIGPFGLSSPVDFTIEIDADNAIDVGAGTDSQQYASNIQLEDTQPNSFILDTIDGAAYDGQVLVMRTFAPSSTFTIAAATIGNAGNIITPDGNDVTGIGDLQMIVFVFDEDLIINANTGGTWRLFNTFGGGGGGLSEPIILTVNTITPETLPTTSIVDWSKNPNHIILDRDVEFSFSNLPVNGKYEGVLVIIDVDATGGYESPVWPASVLNPPTILTQANTRTSVMLYTINGGTVVTHATGVGSSTGANDTSLWANFTAVNDVNFGTFDGTNIDRLLFDQSAGDVLAAGSTGITSNNVGEMQFNIPDQQEYIWSTDAEIRMRLDQSGTNSDTILTVQTPLTDALAVPEILINRIDPTPEINADIGFISFQGSNAASSGGAKIDPYLYARIAVEYQNVVEDREASSMIFVTSFDNGATSDFTPFMILNAANSGNVDFIRDIGMNDNKIIFDDDLDSDTFIQANVSDDDRIDFYANNVNSFAVSYDTGISKGQVGIPSGSNTFFSMLDHFMIWSQITEPADGEVGNSQGDLYFDNATDPPTLKIKKKNTVGDVSVVSLEGVGNVPDGTAQFQHLEWNGSVWVNQQLLTFGADSADSGNIRFPNNTVGIAWRNAADDGNSRFFLDTNDDMILDEADNLQITNTTTGASGIANFVSYRDNTNATNGDELGSIRFDGNDVTDAQTQYARILAGIGEVSDFGILALQVRANNASLQTAIQLEGNNDSLITYAAFNARVNSDLTFDDNAGSTDRKIFPALNALGIVVEDNVSFTVGANGTLAIPVQASLTPTLASLDTAFGTHNGAIGLYNTSDANVVLAIRGRSDEWVLLAIPDAGGTVTGDHINA